MTEYAITFPLRDPGKAHSFCSTVKAVQNNFNQSY